MFPVCAYKSIIFMREIMLCNTNLVFNKNSFLKSKVPGLKTKQTKNRN